MKNPVNAPTLSLKADDLVDWLELTALFDPFGVSRVDALLGALAELAEEPEDNIADRDSQQERLIESIEIEIDLRSTNLGDTYPFALTASGDELVRAENWREARYAFYLICLVTTHVTGSPILRTPPVESLLTRLRNRVFQIVATLGLAGLSSGPAFSVGWPRQTGESIVQLLERAATAGGGFTVRNPPGAYVSPHEKDGGVDMIGWSTDALQPPTVFYFGQTASGRNWPEKPVAGHAELFISNYMNDHMTGNRVFITIIPFRVIDPVKWNSLSFYHKGILDRLRLPLRAWQGVKFAEQGIAVDDASNLNELTQWLSDFVTYAEAA